MQTIENTPKTRERIFLLCEQYPWTVTCLNKKYLEELLDISDTECSCPSCKQDELSSFPIRRNDSFRYNYSKTRGLEITFGIKDN
jgi:hypothetical protein